MNIENPNKKFNTLSKNDVLNWLDVNFPSEAKTWKQATMEIVDMGDYLHEHISEHYSKKVAEPLKDSSKSKTPSEWNIKHKNRIKIGLEIISNFEFNNFKSEFSEWLSKNNNIKLNESQEIFIQDEDLIEDILIYKKNQFNFEGGLFMGTINSGLNTKFGLLWHAKNSIEINSFIESVKNFIEKSDTKLSQFDIDKLTSHYNKYYQL